MEPLHRYILHQALGAGGMGVVHLGTLVSLAGRRRVAIKQLVARGGIDERGRARLIAEARLVFRLNHTNICQVLDLGENDRGTFVVMELVPGLDLRALLQELRAQGRRLDVASAVFIARDVARALDYAHRRTDERGAPLGLVHGDVTPQNILLSVEGEVKLTDFGIANALGGAPGTGLLGGTRGYVAPERVAAGGGDHRADIYALGVTMLVALTGDGASAAQGRIGELPELRPDVSPQLHAIIQRAVAARPAERFLSAAELERELSLELARRFPAFTPSQLAHLVRQCRQRSAVDEAPGEATDTLTSLRDVEDPPPGVDRPAAGAHTQTAAPVRGRRWPIVAAALVVLAVGLAIAVRTVDRTPAPAPAPVPVFVPALAPVPAAIPEPSPSPSPPPPSPPPPKPAAAVRAAPRDAYLTVNATPWGAVYVDGRRLADETPVYRRRVSAGDHVVHVRYADGGVSAPRRVHVAAGETRTLGFAR